MNNNFLPSTNSTYIDNLLKRESVKPYGVSGSYIGGSSSYGSSSFGSSRSAGNSQSYYVPKPMDIGHSGSSGLRCW